MNFQALYLGLAPVLLVACTGVGEPLTDGIESRQLSRIVRSPLCPVLPTVSYIGGGTNGSGCTSNDCGSNTPYVNGYHIDEMHLFPTAPSGLPNHDNLRYAGFIDPSGQFTVLGAEYGELHALTPSGPIRGYDLIGGKIIVEHTVTLEEYVIVIHDYRVDTSWVNGSNVPVRNYLFTYYPGGGGHDDPWRCATTPICDAGGTSGDEDLTWAVVLTDERYDHDSEGNVLPSVAESPASGWFNIACQGTALNKARRMEYFPDASPWGTTGTDVAQRETALKSIVASYCANESFTEDGTPVAWHNSSGTVDTTSLFEDELVIEAIWTDDGAKCINKDALRVPELAPEVQATCPALWAADECDDLLVDNPDLETTAEMVTYVPVTPEPPEPEDP